MPLTVASDRAFAESADVLTTRAGPRPAVGRSTQWNRLLEQAAKVAATEATVLLTGESGTGKEVLARLIHRSSPRTNGSFVAVNCAALPDHLLESEMFGYERGAFTGALGPKPGHIEVAHGGVLFLDEVSEMSAAAQVKILRVLQEREFQRLGGTRVQRANVRVIAATNRDLRAAMKSGDFREDLYYRLQVFEMHIPPLRERKADIEALADAFLQEIGHSLRRPPAGLTIDAQKALLQYEWPGNARELRNALERAAIRCDGGLIAPEHLTLDNVRAPMAGTSNLAIAERNTIDQVMRETRGNKAEAARRLGLSRTQLYVRLRRYELEGPALVEA